MAVLINGNGNPAVYAAQDADWFASIMGNITAITGVGQQFAATQEDANTISVADGVIITQEGRRIQLDANESDLFDIPTGTQGTTNYYIIGYQLTTDETSSQSCDTFVQLMDNGTDTIQEDTFRGGADEVYISLYRVTQTGLNITAIDLLLPTISSIAELNTNLAEFIRRGTMPNLDFTNPLHGFGTVFTYTASKECYLLGSISASNNGSWVGNEVTINGTPLAYINSGNDTKGMFINGVKLSSGDTVVVSNSQTRLHVFDVLS